MAAVILLMAGLTSVFADDPGGCAQPFCSDKDGHRRLCRGARRAQSPHEKAAIIRLNAEVDGMMLSSIKRRVDIARKVGCTLIVFEIDTFGGQLASAIEISKLFKEIPEKDHINTVAWVHDKGLFRGIADFRGVPANRDVEAREHRRLPADRRGHLWQLRLDE